MTKKATIVDVSTGYTSNATLNSNFNAINDKLDNTLSLDGSTPNSMSADLDMNSNDILNASSVSTTSLEVGGVAFVPDSSVAVPSWESGWVTSTAYVLNDLVRNSGSTYICIEAHTSGTFSTDLAANKWELFAQQGAAGAGTGDMLAANNLSDVASAATSRSNLGLGTIAVLSSPSGTVVGTTDTQTLTNKTLTAPVLNGTITGDVIVSEATWETGTDTTPRIPTPANIKAAIDAVATSAPTRVSAATTSGTAVEFNSIPSGAYAIRMGFVGVSLSGTEDILIQLSTGSTYVTTGYVNNAWRINSGTVAELAFTTGFGYYLRDASYENYGVTDLIKDPDTNTWVVQGQIAHGALAYGTSGGITLGGELDGIRIASSGSNTFDAGSVFIEYKVG